MDLNAKILIAGRSGLVGSAIEKALRKQGYSNIIGERSLKVDFLDKEETLRYFNEQKPDFVFICAGRVGGIGDNMNNNATYLYQNTAISFNLLTTCQLLKTKKVLYLGSSCCYPKDFVQPLREDYLLREKLESTNEGYALAKLSAMKLGEYIRQEYNIDIINVIPCNVYGIEDTFNMKRSHVIPALIKKFHQAKMQNDKAVTIWGSGIARREFLFNDDLGEGCVFLMKHYSESSPINIGSGIDISIFNLAYMIKKIVGYQGDIEFDLSKPDGMMKKLLDVSKINNLGWKCHTTLEDGIKKVYNKFITFA